MALLLPIICLQLLYNIIYKVMYLNTIRIHPRPYNHSLLNLLLLLMEGYGFRINPYNKNFFFPYQIYDSNGHSPYKTLYLTKKDGIMVFILLYYHPMLKNTMVRFLLLLIRLF